MEVEVGFYTIFRFLLVTLKTHLTSLDSLLACCDLTFFTTLTLVISSTMLGMIRSVLLASLSIIFSHKHCVAKRTKKE
uniref:Uncharacterized protein n=1 Tax=Glossina pallidipes TaxID=7398 RepID=A0A1A9ZL84_GLOPL